MAADTATPVKTKAPAIPFRKASLRKQSLLPAFNLSAAGGDEYSRELDSKGYLAALDLRLSGTVTADADGVADYTRDWPWAFFKQIEVRDSSGGMLVRMEGFAAAMAAKYFGYGVRIPLQDGASQTVAGAKIARVYDPVAAADGDPLVATLPIYIETNARDNLGLVPNQNASFKYGLAVDFRDRSEAILHINADTSFVGVAFRPLYHYYTVPSPVNQGGQRAQATLPPFAGVVRQQWSESQNDIDANVENTLKITPGKVIRNLIYIPRNSSGERVVGGITRLRLLYGDDQLLLEDTGDGIIEDTVRRYGTVPPLGVYPLTFCDDMATNVGGDARRDYVDTRELAQIYALAEVAATVTSIDVVHDELIVPRGMNL